MKMMKDKLTKSNNTAFDCLCNRLRSFGICIFAISAISFLPINHKLQVDNEVMAIEIGSLKEDSSDATIETVLKKIKINIEYITKRLFK